MTLFPCKWNSGHLEETFVQSKKKITSWFLIIMNQQVSSFIFNIIWALLSLKFSTGIFGQHTIIFEKSFLVASRS